MLVMVSHHLQSVHASFAPYTGKTGKPLAFKMEVTEVTEIKQEAEYKLNSDGKKTWSEAKTDCMNWGGFLDTPTSPQENHNLWYKIRTSCSGFGDIWLGASDRGTEGKWVSAQAHEEIAYTNWFKEQPNGGRQENCAYMKVENGLWNDGSCHRKLNYVCKKVDGDKKNKCWDISHQLLGIVNSLYSHSTEVRMGRSWFLHLQTRG